MAKNKPVAPPKPATTVAAPALGPDQPADLPADVPQTDLPASTTTATSQGQTADAPHGARSVQRGVSAVGLADQVGEVVAGTARVVQTVLPNRLPAYLGAGALLLLGVVDPPIALAGGLTYEALRRWTPRR